MSHLIHIPTQSVHICYSHSPPRHLYNLETDFDWERSLLVRWPAQILNRWLRKCDYHAAQKVSYFIASSQEVARRIKLIYKKTAYVIFPPCLYILTKNVVPRNKRTYYLVVGRLSRRKHIDLAIDICNSHNLQLNIVGSGPEEKYLKQLAGPTIHFLDQKSNLVELYKYAIAVICLGKDEEASIVPVEAMCFGTPVIAYNSGGYKETVSEGKTGVLFNKLNTASLEKAFIKLKSLKVNVQLCQKLATRYGNQKFVKRFKSFVQEKINEHSLPQS